MSARTAEKTVNPVKPPAPYIGGKNRLAKRLTTIIDADEHRTYAEPFVGMGGVFLRRTRMPKSEVINDGNRDVANLFRILQRHYVQFLDQLRFGLTTRTEFERLSATDPDTLTDLERAARFLYLQRTAFGGKVSGQNFGVSPDRAASFNLTRLEPMLEDLHSRLSGVVIECLDFEAFIRRYDRTETLFYLDPPYFGSEGDYGDQFAPADFERLKSSLKTLKGRFILSINDCAQAREFAEGFDIEEVELKYSLAARGPCPRRKELIVSST